ncbi:MAG: pilus assembly protein [Microthrixaceae bacterium]|nr:pilus assembly protein [Microthrixaceae bacterium]MCB1011676.1 pilus assembly protein [Microthrixaceae bacterium]MCO5319905.1 pilus assembly protein [Microthrixaceae bacterium]
MGTRVKNNRRRAARTRGQQGAVLVEAALVLPIMILVVMGIIEFGFAFASSTTTTGASRSGARLGAAAYATAGTISANQRAAADQIADTVSADLVGLTSADPVGMTIYRADPSSTEGEPVGGFPADGMVGGCSSDCFRYTWDAGADKMTYESGGWPDPDACGLNLDSIGVYVQAQHNYITGMIGDHVFVDGQTVMRLEPLPSDQCSGSSS